MTLRLPRGVDEAAVAPQMRKNPSLGKNALLARCVKQLGDLPPHRLEALGPKIFSDLTLTDRRLIDQALNEAAPGVDLVREPRLRRLRRRDAREPGHDPFFGAGLSLRAARARGVLPRLPPPLAVVRDHGDGCPDERRAFVRLLVEQIERENAQIKAARKG